MNAQRGVAWSGPSESKAERVYMGQYQGMQMKCPPNPNLIHGERKLSKDQWPQATGKPQDIPTGCLPIFKNKNWNFKNNEYLRF